MTDESSFWHQLEAWKASDEGKALQRTLAIADEAMRAYEEAKRVMQPIRIYLSNKTTAHPAIGGLPVWHQGTPRTRPSRRHARRAHKRGLK